MDDDRVTEVLHDEVDWTEYPQSFLLSYFTSMAIATGIPHPKLITALIDFEKNEIKVVVDKKFRLS